MQDQRIADLEKQMANKELQFELDKEKILKALKSERANRKIVEADKKAFYRNWQNAISNQQPQQNLQTGVPQTQEMAIVIDSLKKHIISIEQKCEEEKGIILGALRAERLIRKEAQATITVIEKKLQDDTIALKKEVMDKQKDIEFTKRQWSAVSRQAEKTQEERRKKFNEDNAFLKKKLNQVVLEHSNLITETSNERKALEEKNIETEAKLKHKESEILQSEAEYKNKLTAIEVRMTGELAAKDGKVNELEDHIKVLGQEIADLQVSNLHFQELSEKTEKQRVREHSKLITETSSERKALEDQIKVLAQEIADLQVSNLHFQELSEKNEKQRVLELSNLITETSSEKKALEEKNIETEAKLKHKENEILLSEAEYKYKQTMETMEVQMTGELATKDEKVNELEDHIKVLGQKIEDLQVSNLHFQELSEKTDKQKAQIRKDAENATKEEQKRLTKEKKENKKNEKKTQKKETKLQRNINQHHLPYLLALLI